jgi:hypothetical protein
VALLDKETATPPEGAGLESVTVHVVEDDACKVVLPHCTELTRGGVIKDKFAVAFAPLNEAVTVAAWSVENEPAAALKDAVVEPAAMVTLVGTPTAPLEERPTAVLARAGLVSVTEHAADAPGPKDDGVHTRLLRTGSAAEMLPADPAITSGAPATDAPDALLTPIVAELDVGASVTDTMATTPLAMIFPFTPDAKHEEAPDEPMQVSVLPAPVNAGPAETTTLATKLGS